MTERGLADDAKGRAASEVGDALSRAASVAGGAGSGVKVTVGISLGIAEGSGEGGGVAASGRVAVVAINDAATPNEVHITMIMSPMQTPSTSPTAMALAMPLQQGLDICENSYILVVCRSSDQHPFNPYTSAETRDFTTSSRCDMRIGTALSGEAGVQLR